MSKKYAIHSFFSRNGIIIFCLLIWELFSRSGFVNPKLFPPPTAVVIAAIEMIRTFELPLDILVSLSRVLIGFVLGGLTGVGVGILTGRYRFFDRFLTRAIQLLRSVPPIAMVPFAIVWLGLGEPSKWAVIFWGVFFPVWLNTHTGVSNVDIKYIWAAKSLGAKRLDLLKEVILPYALRFIITGLRVSIAIAFICVVVAEMAGASSGLGFRINVSHMVFRVDKMIVALIALGVLGAASDKVFVSLVDKLVPWHKMSSRN